MSGTIEWPGVLGDAPTELLAYERTRRTRRLSGPIHQAYVVAEDADTLITVLIGMLVQQEEVALP